jgi:hypothetical protein
MTKNTASEHFEKFEQILGNQQLLVKRQFGEVALDRMLMQVALH